MRTYAYIVISPITTVDGEPTGQWAWRHCTNVVYPGGYQTTNTDPERITGQVRQALTDLYEHGIMTDAQRGALADLADAHGWDCSRVILDDVGPLWP